MFLEYETPDYTEEGIHEFYRSIHDEAYLSMLSVYGAFGDNELAGRFHTNIITVIFSKPITQLIQSFCKRRKASLLILSTFVGISNTDAGINPGFVDIETTTIIFENFKRQ